MFFRESGRDNHLFRWGKSNVSSHTTKDCLRDVSQRERGRKYFEEITAKSIEKWGQTRGSALLRWKKNGQYSKRVGGGSGETENQSRRRGRFPGEIELKKLGDGLGHLYSDEEKRSVGTILLGKDFRGYPLTGKKKKVSVSSQVHNRLACEKTDSGEAGSRSKRLG